MATIPQQRKISAAEFDQVYDVLEFGGYDSAAVAKWLETPNRALGKKAPNAVLGEGRFEDILRVANLDAMATTR